MKDMEYSKGSGNKIYMCVFLISIFVASKTLAAEQDTASLDKFEVTGSHIKRSDFEGPSPVLIIDRDEINRSGASSVNEILNDLTINNGYMLNENNAITTTPGSAAINLRGLGQDATLILLNGRRMSNYPYPLNTTDTFVDLNSIPLSAVERIEVLKDGASAIYGSDALAGVVNIILRQDYDGSEISGSYGVSAEGDADEIRVNYLKGYSSDKDNITLSLDYFKRESFLLGDRDFSKSALLQDGTDYRSVYTHPANYLLGGGGGDLSNIFDPNPYVTAVPESERLGGMVSYKRDITNDLSFFTDVLVSSVVTNYQLPPTPFDSFVTGVFLPPTHNNNPFGDVAALAWRLTELGPREDEINTDTYRVVAGLEGVYNDWDWEAGIFHANSKSELNGKNYASISAIQNAFNDPLNELDPFDVDPGPSPQSDLDAIRANISRNAETKSKGLDATLTGEVGQLESGPVLLALGFSYLDESLDDKPDAALAAGDIVAQGSTSSEGDRDSKAIFAELSLPLKDNLEMQLALRGDDYSDFGSTVNPKAAIKYTPTNKVMLRASAGTAFRAPSLPELYQSDTLVFGFFVDTARCIAFGGPECNPQPMQVLLSSNPDLEAEESTSFYLGALFEPTKEFSIGVDYWNYDQDNIVTQNTQDTIDQNDPAKVIRPPDPGPDPDPILGVFDQYINSANRKTDGIDIDLRYRWSTNIGNFELRSITTKVFKAEQKTRDADPYVDYAGKYRFPDLRTNLSLTWSRNDYAGTISAFYIDKYEDSFYDIDGHMVDSHLTFDGQIAYSGFENMKLVAGINNIFDEDPPFSNGSFTGYDTATHNPTGRFYYIRLNHQF